MIPEFASRGRLAEELWLVQRQVLRTAFATGIDPAHPGNLVMITSARPGEGKSFAALNLAASIARQGDHAVLLVDADVKKNSLTDLLGFQDQPGLLDLSETGDINASRVIRTTEIPGLSIISHGLRRPRNTDQISRRQTARVMQGLARQDPNRVVILDTAPCLALGDASALAAIVGQIVFVIEAERTQRSEVENAIELLQDCPSIALLLNKMTEPPGGASFGSYTTYYSP
jgi:protein-tyrosine kinase